MRGKRSFLMLMVTWIMILTMGVTAMAAEPDSGSITVDNAVNGKEYSIYRIFDLESHNEDYSAVNYTVSEKWKAFFAEGEGGLTYVDLDEVNDELSYVVWKEGADAAEFAEAAKQYAETKSIVPDGNKTASAGKAVFENLPLGYYLVRSDVNADAICSLDTTAPNALIREKSSKPTIKKEVEEDSTKGFGKSNDADLGEKVNFKITVAAIDGSPKNYVVHDTMSQGLKFDPDSVQIIVNEEQTPLTKGTDYTVVTEGLGDTCAFEIRFADIQNTSGELSSILEPNDVAVITYSAEVTDLASIGGTGNSNAAKLSYTDKNGTSSVTEETEDSQTYTYVWKMDVLKYTEKSGAEIALKDAQFVLYKEADGKTQYVVAEEGTNHVTGWTENAYDSQESVKATVFTTPDDGKFDIVGLDADTYYLKEIKAPAGYNMLKAPIKVVITASVDPATHEGTATVTYNGSSTGTVKVENNTGTLLPSTGGFGTTLFYVLGGLLFSGACVVLVTKKRMANAER